MKKDKVTLIAEISGNHKGSIKRAKDLIHASHLSGADFVKLQAYTPDTITLNSDAPEFTTKWGGQQISLHKLYEKAYTPFEWFPELFTFARERRIKLFASVFDKTSVDMLQKLRCPMYKISSFEITDIPLIEYTASKGKPIILSTGMATLQEIREAISACVRMNNFKFSLLHCNSAYPADPKSARLKNIPEMKRLFTCPIGLSDHTTTHTTAVAAVALGATIVEKHVTLNPYLNGPDDHFSIMLPQLKALRDCIDDAYSATTQTPLFQPKANEEHSLKLRRSLYFIKDLAEGEQITPEHIGSFRPALGLAPGHQNTVIGKAAARDIKANTPVTWEDLQ